MKHKGATIGTIVLVAILIFLVAMYRSCREGGEVRNSLRYEGEIDQTAPTRGLLESPLLPVSEIA